MGRRSEAMRLRRHHGVRVRGAGFSLDACALISLIPNRLWMLGLLGLFFIFLIVHNQNLKAQV